MGAFATHRKSRHCRRLVAEKDTQKNTERATGAAHRHFRTHSTMRKAHRSNDSTQTSTRESKHTRNCALQQVTLFHFSSFFTRFIQINMSFAGYSDVIKEGDTVMIYEVVTGALYDMGTCMAPVSVIVLCMAVSFTTPLLSSPHVIYAGCRACKQE